MFRPTFYDNYRELNLTGMEKDAAREEYIWLLQRVSI
jgi:hypothetical protein